MADMDLVSQSAVCLSVCLSHSISQSACEKDNMSHLQCCYQDQTFQDQDQDQKVQYQDQDLASSNKVKSMTDTIIPNLYPVT